MELPFRPFALVRAIASWEAWRGLPRRTRVMVGVALVGLAVLLAGVLVGALSGGLIASLWTRPPPGAETIP
jgi:hypothetical protein